MTRYFRTYDGRAKLRVTNCEPGPNDSSAQFASAMTMIECGFLAYHFVWYFMWTRAND